MNIDPVDETIVRLSKIIDEMGWILLSLTLMLYVVTACCLALLGLSAYLWLN